LAAEAAGWFFDIYTQGSKYNFLRAESEYEASGARDCAVGRGFSYHKFPARAALPSVRG